MGIKSLISVAVTTLIATASAGCGGSDDTADSKPAATPKPAAAQKTAAKGATTITMTEFAFAPSATVAQRGKLTITATNAGDVVHELVVLKTDTDPGKLPKAGAKVDESSSVGEIADVEPGATKKHTFDLAPGKYAVICALPGHYEGGMYGSLTVE